MRVGGTPDENQTGATQPKRGVALLVAFFLSLLVAGCDGAAGSSGERIRLLITPVPTPTSPPPAQPTSAPIKYTVQPGDTLFGIALTFGVTVDDIVRANNIADPNSLSEGQVLTIPQRSAPATATSTPGPLATATATPPPLPAPPSATPPPPDATPPQGPDVPDLPAEAPAPTATTAAESPTPQAVIPPDALPTGAAEPAGVPGALQTAGPAQSP
jgi:LysM repeat protein